MGGDVLNHLKVCGTMNGEGHTYSSDPRRAEAVRRPYGDENVSFASRNK